MTREMKDFCLLHPHCEVAGCRAAPAPEPHHIRTRGAGGTDDPVNLIRLCGPHHVEVHKVGRWTFADRYNMRARFERAINQPRGQGRT